MAALANVIGFNIVSSYPFVNGLTDKTALVLNTTFMTRNNNAKRSIHLFWTSSFDPKDRNYWTPNHFVPLMNLHHPETDSIESEEEGSKTVINNNSPLESMDISEQECKNDTKTPISMRRSNVPQDQNIYGAISGGGIYGEQKNVKS